MPYLRIFGPDNVSREHDLAAQKTVLGRSADAGIQLDTPSVSRQHATVARVGAGHEIRDANSTHGTLLNGKRIERAPLQHGDVIQIGRFVIEYRTDDDERSAEAALSRSSLLGQLHETLRKKYRPLPAGMKVKYRTLSCRPEDVFAPGDTLQVGHGGILLPGSGEDMTGQALEVALTWPNRQGRQFLGEVMAMLPRNNPDGGEASRPDRLCIKLHNVDAGTYENTVLLSRRGQWVEP